MEKSHVTELVSEQAGLFELKIDVTPALPRKLNKSHPLLQSLPGRLLFGVQQAATIESFTQKHKSIKLEVLQLLPLKSTHRHREWIFAPQF